MTKTERIYMRCDPHVKKLIEQAAAKENRTVSNWIESKVLEALQKQIQ